MLITNAARLLRDEPARDLEILVDVLRRAHLGSGHERVLDEAPDLATLRVVFQCEPEDADALLERLRGAGPDPITRGP